VFTLATDLSFLTGSSSARLTDTKDANYVSIRPGNVYFTTDGKIYFDLNSTTRKWMGENANYASTAGSFSSARTIKLTGEVTGSISGTGASGWTIATTVTKGIFLRVNGEDTMTGVLKLKADVKNDTLTGGALDVQGSSINKVHALFFNAANTTSGIQFARSDDATKVDGIYASNGTLYFVANRALGSDGTGQIVLTSSNYSNYAVQKNGSNATGTGWPIGITGNAATATKLTSDAGDATHPIYFANGVPV